MIREAIGILVSRRSLSMEQASEVMGEIMNGEATQAQIGAFLTALHLKGETVEEIAGMARVMREKALRVSVDGLLVDTCGTGGDGSGTFNISTAAALVAAGAGLKVAKHGNRGMSSACGSADVLEALGAKIELDPDGVKRCLEEVGIGFMFAPLFHPAMKHAVGPRREIGIRTVFNILGPLTNPAGAQTQVIGVPDKVFGPKVAQALKLLGVEVAMVVHGLDGMDELSTCGPTLVWEVDQRSDRPRSYTVAPEDVGISRSSLEDIRGGTAPENADIIRRVLGGERGPARDAVLLNAAAALKVGGRVDGLKEGVDVAAEAIDSGKAQGKLEAFVRVSRGL
jgi:anthranilate phosphoribosyltransferase